MSDLLPFRDEEGEALAGRPGLYRGLDHATYAAIPTVKRSALMLLDEDRGTPKHARAEQDGLLPRPQTDTFRLGRAEHCWICEGEAAFRRQFLVAPDACGAEIKSRPGDRCGNRPRYLTADGDWRCGSHVPKGTPEPADYLNEEDVGRIRAMGDAVRASDIFDHMDRRAGLGEATLVWGAEVAATVAGDGPPGQASAREVRATLRQKTRVDFLALPFRGMPHRALEFKRMQLLTGFMRDRERAVEKYGWDVQAALHAEGVRAACSVDRVQVAWVFVEDAYPHAVRWFTADDATLEIGADKLRRYREEWLRCEVSGEWPGYMRPWPAWAGPAEPPAGGLPARYVKWYRDAHGGDDAHPFTPSP